VCDHGYITDRNDCIFDKDTIWMRFDGRQA
jgi:hypothetical protein